MHDAGLCAYSVASPILGQGEDNQNATTGRISCDSAIRYRDGTEANRDGAAHDKMRASYQRTRQGQPQPASATPPQQASHLSAHRPPPHPSPPHPSLGAGQRPRKIPHLQNFVRKSKPETALSVHTHPVFVLSDYPLPPLQGTLPPLKYFWGLLFRALRGLDCPTIPYGTLLPLLCHMTAIWHIKCHIGQIWLNVYAVYMSIPMCIDFGLLSTCGGSCYSQLAEFFEEAV